MYSACTSHSHDRPDAFLLSKPPVQNVTRGRTTGQPRDFVCRTVRTARDDCAHGGVKKGDGSVHTTDERALVDRWRGSATRSIRAR